MLGFITRTSIKVLAHNISFLINKLMEMTILYLDKKISIWLKFTNTNLYRVFFCIKQFTLFGNWILTSTTG